MCFIGWTMHPSVVHLSREREKLVHCLQIDCNQNHVYYCDFVNTRISRAISDKVKTIANKIHLIFSFYSKRTSNKVLYIFVCVRFSLSRSPLSFSFITLFQLLLLTFYIKLLSSNRYRSTIDLCVISIFYSTTREMKQCSILCSWNWKKNNHQLSFFFSLLNSSDCYTFKIKKKIANTHTQTLQCSDCMNNNLVCCIFLEK